MVNEVIALANLSALAGCFAISTYIGSSVLFAREKPYCHSKRAAPGRLVNVTYAMSWFFGIRPFDHGRDHLYGQY